MRGRRITAAAASAAASALALTSTGSTAAAAAAAASSSGPLQAAAFGCVPPVSSSTSTCSAVVANRASPRSTGRSYHSSALATSRLPPLAFHNNRRGGAAGAGAGGDVIRRLHAHAAATLVDLSASSASNEDLHTLSESGGSNDDNSNDDNDQSQPRAPKAPKPRPRPIIICGPSGVGKGTIINALLQKFPSDKFGFSVSHTTRQPRPGEINGTHYNFVSVDEIQTEIAEGKFLEYAEVHGNYYGTSLQAVETVQRQGKLCILDIDVQGVQSIKSQGKLEDAICVFVAPPSVDNLEQRLRGRGTETEETLARRLGNARKEMEYGNGEGNFDYVLVNGELDVAVEELAEQMRGWYPTMLDEDESKVGE